ncbi:hypothetical protein Hjap01_01740 [Haloarcula japonica]
MITGSMCLLRTPGYVEPEKNGTPIPNETMSTNATDNTTDAATDDQERRYAELNIGDEEFVIYDRENHQAWIQSTESLEVADLR